MIEDSHSDHRQPIRDLVYEPDKTDGRSGFMSNRDLTNFFFILVLRKLILLGDSLDQGVMVLSLKVGECREED
jgi:hypothetical protein